MIVLRSGDLAYWDTFSGMVPVRIVEYVKSQPFFHTPVVRVQILGTRGPYKKFAIEDADPHQVIPRKIRHIRGTYGQRYIVPPYTFEGK